MKETVTEYDTQEVRKTVTDYETHEIETEQYVSDLSGSVIDEDNVIALQADPKIKDTKSYDHISNPHEGRLYFDTYRDRMRKKNVWESELHDIRKDQFEIESGGEIHVSVSEFTELADIDEENIDVDDELPEAYVNAAEPEVNTLFDDSLLWIIFAAYMYQNLISLVIGDNLGITHTMIGLQLAMGVIATVLLFFYIPSPEPSYEYHEW